LHLVRYFCRTVQLFTEVFTGISLPAPAQIGPGLLIPHYGPLVINHAAVIGANCFVHHGVTIGASGIGERRGSPKLGDRVFIGANAVVVGPIAVGDDVMIGAGAVVTKSIPDRAIVVGNPAKIVSYRGSFDYVRYAGMEQDDARANSIALREPDERSTTEREALTALARD